MGKETAVLRAYAGAAVDRLRRLVDERASLQHPFLAGLPSDKFQRPACYPESLRRGVVVKCYAISRRKLLVSIGLSARAKHMLLEKSQEYVSTGCVPEAQSDVINRSVVLP